MMSGFPSLTNHIGADSQDERDIGNNGMGVDKLVENAAKNLLSGLIYQIGT